MYLGNGDKGNFSIPRMDALSHAYIVWGGSEAEQSVIAEKLASAMVCSGSGQKPCMTCNHCYKALRHIHPDIIAIDRLPDAREIYVDQIRALREDAVIMPNEALKKVYVMHHAGCMNVFAQNAILKLLEEPPASAAFILIADNPAELLPTVRSRCVELSADRLDTTEPVQIRDDAAAFYQVLTDGPLKLAEFSFAMEKYEKSDFASFIDSAKTFLVQKMRDCLSGAETALTPEYMMKAVTVLDRAREYLDLNVSLGHIAGMICAEMIRAG
jgi:DNA polymerase-3 subunit delta'